MVDDLIFLSKIQATAKAVGVNTIGCGRQPGTATIAQARPAAILLDLNHRQVPVIDWIRALKADPATRQIRIVGFVSHVQEQLIAEARGAGCDTVMARSAFVQQLPNLLRSLGRAATKSGEAGGAEKEY